MNDMNTLDDLIEFNKRFYKFENIYNSLECTLTQLSINIKEKKSLNFEKIMNVYECTILVQISFGLFDVNKYYNGEIDFNISDFIEMILCVKESMPQLSKKIDSIVLEDVSNVFYNSIENHNKLKSALNLYKNVMDINNGLLAI